MSMLRGGRNECVRAPGVRYSRVMRKEDRASSAIGRGWAAAFGVRTPEELEQKVARGSGEVEELQWLDGGGDTVRHSSPVLPAIRVAGSLHAAPKLVFFNQILAAHQGWRDELNAPGRSVVFGNGREMPARAIEAMARVFAEDAVAVPWRHGDVMLLDNMQVMHSRETFVGPRRVLASLAYAPKVVAASTAAPSTAAAANAAGGVKKAAGGSNDIGSRARVKAAAGMTTGRGKSCRAAAARDGVVCRPPLVGLAARAAFAGCV